MILTPTHGSLPSGHATEAFLVARLLWKLLRASKTPQYQEHGVWGEMLMRQAARIAVNRTVAGVHFPVDSVAGAILGLTLANYIHELSDKNVTSRTNSTFEGPRFDAEDDFDWHLLYDAASDEQKKRVGPKGKEPWSETKSHKIENAVISPPLDWLWDNAVKEWQDFD